MNTDTEIATQNSCQSSSTEQTDGSRCIDTIGASPVASETRGTTGVVIETRDIAASTPTHELPRVTTPARKTGRSRVAPAWPADYVMD